jgi:hypothetical protein
MDNNYGPPSEVEIDVLKKQAMDGYFKREVESRRPVTVALPSVILTAITALLERAAFGGSKAGDDDLTAVACASVVAFIISFLLLDLRCRSAALKSACDRSTIRTEVLGFVGRAKNENLERLRNDAAVTGRLMKHGGEEGLLPLGPSIDMFGKLAGATAEASKRWEGYVVKVRKALDANRG